MNPTEYDGYYDDTEEDNKLEDEEDNSSSEEELAQSHLEIEPKEIAKLNSSLRYFLSHNKELTPEQHHAFELNLEELSNNLKILEERDKGFYPDEIPSLIQALKLLAEILNTIPTTYKIKIMKCQELIRKYLANADAYSPELEEKYYSHQLTTNTYDNMSKEEIYNVLLKEEQQKIIDKTKENEINEIREIAKRDAEVSFYTMPSKRSFDSNKAEYEAIKEAHDSIFNKPNKEQIQTLNTQKEAAQENKTIEELNQRDLDNILSKTAEALVKSHRKNK